jgi:hypothetical protein
MKKICVVMMLLSLIIPLFAADTLGSKQAQDIVGFVDMVHVLTVTPSTNNTFDVKTTDVQQKDGVTGLLIGTWSVMTNYPNATLKITAAPLKLSTDTTKVIPYQLGIQYPDTNSTTKVAFVNCDGTANVDWSKGNYALPYITLSDDANDKIVSCTDMGLYVRIRTTTGDIAVGTYNGSISFTLSST